MPVMVLIHFPTDIANADAAGATVDMSPIAAAWKKHGAKHYHQIVRDGEFMDLDEFPSAEAYVAFKAEAGPTIAAFESAAGVSSTDVVWEIKDRRGA